MPLLLLLLMSAQSAAARPNAYYDASRPHHTPEGFRNNYEDSRPGNFWKWMWERWRNGRPDPMTGYQPQVVRPDLARLRANGAHPSVTWIGHATLLVRIGGQNVLTDPQFSERASPLSFMGPRRAVPPAIPLADLPHIDVVVVSHNHYDHLDRDSLVGLNAQAGGPPLFLVPLGLKPWLAEQGISNAVELDWWRHHDHRGLRLYLLPVQHWSARTPFDRNETLWGGWLVDHPTFRFFFCGDSGYSPDFKDIAARFAPIDLAAIPIGSYEPRWFMRTMHANPEEAVRIHQDLKARHSLGMHWGTFPLTDEPLAEPPRKLAEALAQADVSPQRFFLLKFGETRTLPERPGP